MRVLIFIRNIFKKFPFLLVMNTGIIFLETFVDALSIFSLIVLVDLFINPELKAVSPITKQIIVVMKSIGIPVTLGWLFTVFMAFNIFKVSFQIFSNYSILKMKYAVLRDIFLRTFEDFFNAKWYFFSSSKQGMLLNTFIRELDIVGDAFGAMARYFAGILHSTLYLAVLFFLSWQVTSICLVMALLFAAPFTLFGKISYRLGKLNTSTSNQLSSVIQESLALAKIILGFGNQRKSAEEFGRTFEAHRRATIKSQTIDRAIPSMYYPLGMVVMIIGFLTARKIGLPLSEATVVLYSLMKVIPTFGQVVREKNSLDNFFPSYEQVMNLQNRAKKLKQQTGKRIFIGFNNEISIEKLSFAYPDQGLTLSDISLDIPKGNMIAIVGESGVGKSTFIDMLMGFYEPTSGCIKFDGIPLQEFDIYTYRQRLGYVPQDSVLFNMSIRDNLLWAKGDVTEEEMREACRQANAEEFIEKLPKKYDTVVGDRGVRLSGGQVQRIALARAVLRKPALLILDEATSSLDTYSERLIQQSVEVIAKETTVVSIAHRLSTIVNADYIYVLKGGRIAEKGTYLDLVRLNGHFSHMVQLQALEVAK